MTAQEFQAAISLAGFQRELHHLLWIDPFVNKGTS